MRWRSFTWVLFLLMALAWFCWLADRPKRPQSSGPTGLVLKEEGRGSGVEGKTFAPATHDPRPPLGITNTAKSLAELARSGRAILLENALLDTTDAGSGDPAYKAQVSALIPASLRSQEDPGAYIVQSRGVPSGAFQHTIRVLGGEVIGYLPINAFLVRAGAEAMQELASDPETQTILPYEPYYKLKGEALDLAVQGSRFKVQSSKFNSETGAPDDQGPPTPDPRPSTLTLNILLFANSPGETDLAIRRLGISVLRQDRSPFGPTLSVRCSGADLAALAQLPGVQEIELARQRRPANDLSRATVGAAADSTTQVNYLGLTGTNVLVAVADTGVDATQPDLTGRVLADAPLSGADTNGHGTHVAGIIAGSGIMSTNLTNAPGSAMPPANLQFRGKAPGATIFSLLSSRPDSYLQQTASSTNAAISENGWTYDSNDYDLAAASYDAAVRDAVPSAPGSQPMLFVFAAGNQGGGNNDGAGGVAGSVQSPGTAKNVVTVGAAEQLRSITNLVWQCTPAPDTNNPPNCQTNAVWLGPTDSSNQVAAFSGRGNVGIGVEGPFGRFKPDIVAPGTFVISTRSSQWNKPGYYGTTNSPGTYFDVLSNLNETLGPYYRFESGSSMASADVAGTLALMQEFFQQRVGLTNSPALMKALLINGARPLSGLYSPQIASATNLQGWGMIHLPSSAPASLTNGYSATNSMLFFDQDATRALATGQSHVRLITVAADAHGLPLRLTLVWTDPPGHPLASLKLVNDLDLIVTNLDTGEVFFGNDLQPGNLFNSAWNTNTPPNSDFVNNVENIFLAPPLSTNYSVTVLGKRVSVNAVTGQTNDISQDYALVVSSGDGEKPDALSLAGAATNIATAPQVTILTNGFVASSPDSGCLLINQRVSANNPLSSSASVPYPGSTNAAITLGAANQWHFYVITNDNGFTNAAFLTFLPHSLALSVSATNVSSAPKSGSSRGNEALIDWGPEYAQNDQSLATSAATEADIDLYVSTNSALLSLDSAAVSNAWKSLGRGGTETVVVSDALPVVYYVGVKSESQEAVEYGFLGLFSALPYAQTDLQGNQVLRGFPAPSSIPTGAPGQPGLTRMFCVAPQPGPVHRVVITNILSHPAVSNLTMTLCHAGVTAVIQNHPTNGAAVSQAFVFDDSQQQDIPGALSSVGPGSLHSFAGKEGFGQWLFTVASTNQAGTNDSLLMLLEPEPDLTVGTTVNLLPGACRDEFITVLPGTTNLTLTADLMSGAGPVSVNVCPAAATGNVCQSSSVTASVTHASVVTDKFSNPPLNAGLYSAHLCNTGADEAQVILGAAMTLDPKRLIPVQFTSSAPAPISDDAVSVSTIHVTNNASIASVSVGVRIDHPRVSDLVLRLIGPDGTRVLLDGNRGGDTASGMGAETLVTNVFPVSYLGGPEAVTNIVDTGVPTGTVTIHYDMYSLPDDMRVYYEGQLLYDSGMVSHQGSTNLTYGPGSSTQLTIVMNQGGNPNQDTAWTYSVTSVRPAHVYLTFSEDSNTAFVPIKFASPPFTNLTLVGATVPPTNGILYFPEQSLNKFGGKSAFGDWKLEILDSRAGAAIPPPMVLSWQLSFLFNDSQPLPSQVNFGSTMTNSAPPGRIQYLAVSAPPWARYSTNRLITASAPVCLLFNQSLLPTGTNSAPPDYMLLAGTTAGVSTLSSTGTPPAFLPGYTYFLGVQNTNSSPVTFTLAVDFDITPLTNGVPLSTVLAAGPQPRYFSYDVSSNATSVAFQILNPSGGTALAARRGLPLPDMGSFDYASSFPGTNNQQIIIFTNSTPVPLSPGRWYLGAYNTDITNVACSVLATEYTNAVPEIIVLANGVPFANTNSAGPTPVDFYEYTISTNARRAQFEINSPTADMTLVARRGLPLPDLTSYGLISSNPGTNDELIVLYDNSGAVRLAPGVWFLSAVNVSSITSSYSIKATEFTAYGTPIIITNAQWTTNSFCLTWTSLPGVHYAVQGRTDFTTSTNWPTVSPTITASDYFTTWCLSLPSSYHFFRVREGLVVTPAPVNITSIASATNGVMLRWNASSNSLFDVQWTPTLAPAAWSAFTNIVSITNGGFQFLDDGTQSGGLGPARYYRLRLRP
ncbi:MAG: hypothetical protein C5B50_08300 [Verrucomicrobia bacterium]|nr:MAG: hypothetical protein C5B50_08300 [Verrucomicrobiota bacterium]